MPVEILIVTALVAIALAPAWRFFFKPAPLTEDQRKLLQSAQQYSPTAEHCLRAGLITRHQYRQIVIAAARGHRKS